MSFINYNLFTRRRASKGYKRSVHGQVPDAVLKNGTSKKRELTEVIEVIRIRPLAPVQNSVSLKLMQRYTLNFVINALDVENITK